MKMIRTPRSSRFTVPDWVKWLLAGLALCGLLVFGFSYWVYTGIMEEKTAGFQKAKELALAETSLTQAISVQNYNGDRAVHIVTGKTEKNIKGYAFVNPEKDKIIKFIQQSEILNKADMKKAWQSSCENCQMIEVQLGMENEVPLWEITYIDDQGRYVFAYFDVKSGKRKQLFAFKRS
ncbi:DUF5590 domain-containing protein [Thalassobacillus pellis]|uniref:cell wall elongation regulator TseB-like domain-containing protein n=1 Tax=Thalassobacillus pellis TaxID=748008 RepID=UPI001961E187|nr:DUF5590 domain-containing protein [Thalassobacillus pellis]MBM7552495.1 uncharacterized protein YpmB [Thalassobacillus pellis]